MPDKLNFLGAEYKGRKVFIRRSANYQVMISSVKKSFSALRSTPAYQISLSARVREINLFDCFEVPEDLWPTILPRIDEFKIHVDASARPPSPEPTSDSDTSEVDNKANVLAPKRTPEEPQASPSTMPPQPKRWKDVHEENIISATYIRINGSSSTEKVLVTPETTISDLKAFLATRVTARVSRIANCSFTFDGLHLDDNYTVGDWWTLAIGSVVNVYVQ
ncbi:hypothetical protein FRC12_007107 [Ceratobasidium sp. 428]|nr:hypothetical protein FRC12_007107 [Ceratobasidium sp. 428]